jgi:hypothetical protein
MTVCSGGHGAMSSQTLPWVFSSVPADAEEEADAACVTPTKQLLPGAAALAASPESELAFGCVDWYLYPDPDSHPGTS